METKLKKSLYEMTTGRKPDSFAVSTIKALALIPWETAKLFTSPDALVRTVLALAVAYGAYTVSPEVRHLTDDASRQMASLWHSFMYFENMSSAAPTIDDKGNLCVTTESKRFGESVQVGTCPPRQ